MIYKNHFFTKFYQIFKKENLIMEISEEIEAEIYKNCKQK